MVEIEVHGYGGGIRAVLESGMRGARVCIIIETVLHEKGSRGGG